MLARRGAAMLAVALLFLPLSAFADDGHGALFANKAHDGATTRFEVGAGHHVLTAG